MSEFDEWSEELKEIGETVFFLNKEMIERLKDEIRRHLLK